MATKKAAKKSATKKSPAKSSAKKSPAKKSTGGQACWPGFKRVAGKTAGTKGSCEPKDKQTGSEKKADSKAAAASKREKTGH
jgi:hypothetical protein